MSYLHAIALGIIQGLTEFLPISSSGHLAVVQEWLGYQPESPEMMAFDVVSHLGTLAAAAVVFRRPLVRLLASRRHALRILGLCVAPTVITAAIGLSCNSYFKSLFGQSRLIGGAFIVTGVVLFVAARAPRPRKGWKQFTILAASLVGLAQALAIVPGLSRSGLTICAATLLGLRRRWAVEFSFLIAAPAILGATILELKDLFDVVPADQLSDLAGPLTVGGVVAFGVGLLALMLLLRMVQRAKLHWFSYYLWPLGLYILFRGAA
ncbi:MAG: undecaprenyl-diphosphate phosphatase [Planctomycetes bacterium]|nr:undecaprenyl-diphosphate phosphatase [Planctomycetota bacterium]